MRASDIIKTATNGLISLLSAFPDINIGYVNIDTHLEIGKKVEVLKVNYPNMDEEELCKKIVKDYLQDSKLEKPVYMNGVYIYTKDGVNISNDELEEIRNLFLDSEYEGNVGGEFWGEYIEETENILAFEDALIINFIPCMENYKYDAQPIVEVIDWLNEEVSSELEFTKFVIF